MLARPIDDLGRLVIPKEIRDFLRWNHKDKISITPQGRNLILGKVEAICSLCNKECVETDLVTLPNESMVCHSCMKTVLIFAQTHEHSHL